jgi:hypothetical protein
MAELNAVAKRIHNVSPEPVRLVLADGDAGVYRMRSTEFFQREFRGEGVRVDPADDADYRLVTSDGGDAVMLGRQAPGEDGWQLLGTVTAAERVELDAGDEDEDEGGV